MTETYSLTAMPLEAMAPEGAPPWPKFDCAWCLHRIQPGRLILVSLTHPRTGFDEAALVHCGCYVPFAQWVSDVWATVTRVGD